MKDIDILLNKLRRTNPSLTQDKLIEELKKSTPSTVAILLTMENVKRVAD